MYRPLSLLILLAALPLAAQESSHSGWPEAADKRGPMSADEAKVFMKKLAQHAVEHHMKKSSAPQRGLMYEYVWWKQRGKPGQFIEGEALDTMHDGAWFAVAM